MHIIEAIDQIQSPDTNLKAVWGQKVTVGCGESKPCEGPLLTFGTNSKKHAREVQLPPDSRKHLGIPEAIFVEDVDAFMKQPGNDTADAVLRKLDEQYQKYKYMELNLGQKKLRLKSQIPQIKQTLEILRHMQKKKDTTDPMETHFLLADNVYCKASVPPTDKVCLWLGANVMLEYDIDAAQALLEKNLATASRNLDSLEEDLDFLRDQFTTTEVNMARVYNWDVKRRSKDNLLKSAERS